MDTKGSPSAPKEVNLSAIAHDSVLFKNISNDSVAHLISLYGKSEKQSFIALDEIKKCGESAAATLVEQSVIQLGDQAVLYVKEWRPSRPAVPTPESE